MKRNSDVSYAVTFMRVRIHRQSALYAMQRLTNSSR